MSDFFGFAPPPAKFGGNYAYWHGALTPAELKDMVKVLDELPLKPATVTGHDGSNVLDDIRRAKTAFVPVNDKTSWFLERLADVTTKINADWFGYNLSGFNNLQFTVYAGEDQGHYDWHVDTLGKDKVQRKLSFIMMLSDPMDYEGGEVWLWNNTKAVLSKAQGMIHFFPSFCLHRVTPVTKGLRKTLVGWVAGPDFM